MLLLATVGLCGTVGVAPRIWPITTVTSLTVVLASALANLADGPVWV